MQQLETLGQNVAWIAYINMDLLLCFEYKYTVSISVLIHIWRAFMCQPHTELVM